MRVFSIFATAAALVLGLQAYAIAGKCSFEVIGGANVTVITDHLVLDDVNTVDGPTNVGSLSVECLPDHRLRVAITTHDWTTTDGFYYDSYFLMSIFDLVYVGNEPSNCRDYMANDGYTNRKGNPKLGNANQSVSMQFKKNDWEDGELSYIFDIPQDHVGLCLIVTAELFNAAGSNAKRTDGHASRYRAYIDKSLSFAMAFSAKSPYAFIYTGH